MSIQPIVTILKKLIKIHEILFDLSKEKTESIKEGDADSLQATLLQEQKAIQSAQLIEDKRGGEVKQWFTAHQLPLENATITGILDVLSDSEEKFELEKVAAELTELIVKIKQQEQLNQALLQQSMKFVQLSLSMLNPSIDHFNYNQNHQTAATEHSVFDSKA